LSERGIIVTRHAAERIVRFEIDLADLEKTLREGERLPEGKSKARYRLRTKKGLLIVICREFPDQIVVITVTRRR